MKTLDIKRKKQRRYKEEQARLAEERYQKIQKLLKGVEGVGSGLSLRSLKGISSEEPLQLKRETAFFGIPGNPPDGSAELQLKRIDSSDIVAINASPLVQLNSATFLSQKAAQAKSDEDAKLLSNAAFEVVVKGKVQLAIPPEVTGVPVSQAHIDKFSTMQKSLLSAQENLDKANGQLSQIEYAKRLAEQARKEAERRLKESQNMSQSVSVEKPEEKKASDDKTAEAQKLLNEAIELDEKMAAELDKAVNNVNQAQLHYNDTEKETKNYLSELGRGRDASQ